MMKTVADIMTPNPFTVKPSDSLNEAIKLIAEKRVSGLPVIDEKGQLVGVISETDLMWKETGVDTPPYVMFLDSIIYLQNPARHAEEVHKVLGETVGDVMSDRPITIEQNKSIKDAAHILHEKGIRRLPVVNGEGTLVGIISRGDIIRAMAMDL
ncbi:MAG: CBS domain-containing protein [Synechococcaceae cyanobacterium RL_1_2]|nr:CBS domain-containing protein [Synechococcaceae cyanobacterium RL_1_2]